jgi:PhzF family phenazine biosynthesis protein
MRFWIADAFTEELFGGNPAGVVLIPAGEEFPPDSIMIRTAAELRYSETAFVKRLGEKDFHLRYFTPTDEVDLCGHATIASFGVLVEEGLIRSGDFCSLQTKAGSLQVEIRQGMVFMEMGDPVLLGPVPDLSALAGALGIFESDFSMEPAIVSTGLPDILVPVSSRERLLSMKPDFPAMAELSRELSVVGVHAFCLDSNRQVTAWCRNFAPLYGIDEEAATGTANGALTEYLYQKGILGEEARVRFLQGESMGRPSEIHGIFSATNKPRIQIGGSCRMLAKGELLI